MGPRQCIILTATLLLTAGSYGCGDLPAAPVASEAGDTTNYATMTERELLVMLLQRMDALEARVEQHEFSGGTGLRESNLSTGRLAAARAQNSYGVGAEATICAEYEFKADAKMESKVRMSGGGLAGAGVDAYGNGAVAAVSLQALQELHFVPEGSGGIKLEVCGKLALDRSRDFGPQASPSTAGDRLMAAAPQTSQAQQLLQAALEALPPDQIAAAASRLGMEGTRMSRGVDMIAGLSLSDLPFGRGAAASLIDVLPLPHDLATVARDPQGLAQEATAAGRYAIDRLCDQSLFTGEFVQRASSACDLRDRAPDPGELLQILGGIEDLSDVPVQVGHLENDLSNLCSRVAAMGRTGLRIPPHKVDFPLEIGTVTTFPGYDGALFPRFASAC